jgi:DNA-binding XRE family transcriptional regulator
LTEVYRRMRKSTCQLLLDLAALVPEPEHLRFAQNEKPETFGQWLEWHRRDLGLRQLEVANHIGVADTTISEWENDKRRPKLDAVMMIRICEILDCELNDLKQALAW